MNCSAVFDGADVVITCVRVGINSQRITLLQYSINGGATRTGKAEGLSWLPFHIAHSLPFLPYTTYSYICVEDQSWPIWSCWWMEQHHSHCHWREWRIKELHTQIPAKSVWAIYTFTLISASNCLIVVVFVVISTDRQLKRATCNNTPGWHYVSEKLKVHIWQSLYCNTHTQSHTINRLK